MLTARLTAVTATLASVAIGAIAVAASTGSAAAREASAAHHRSTSAVLNVAKVKVGGKGSQSLLVSASGMPVYALSGDSQAHPKCDATDCLSVWPALITATAKPMAGKGVAGKLGVWRHNHVIQVTLNGHPLYTYSYDSRDSATGEGLKSFGGTWQLVKPNGSPLAKASSGKSGGGW